ncbi:MAG: AAA family ATPase [Hoeflea sp.]|uniref:AAA family ATPase n=1 Tax=Hoeflea sp. TaxID=1940281 RepID=UPI003EF86895
MRLNRLDLTRYGKFTDHVIDFGSPAAGGCDLHIVYGPNEAGKSTLFSAWLDLLFGIGAQSSYNFLHPYPNMRIGAAIDLDGKTEEFVRIKRPQNSLLDGRDQAISDGALLAGLGGLDRSSYQTMFSLDDETLEQGGESILASRGDLGELLFSASAGLGELSQHLVQLRTETEEFYKPRAQKRILGELKAELADLKAERERIDTQASKYTQLNKELEETRARHDEAGEKRKHLRGRLATVDRLLTARPRLADLERLQDQIEPLRDLPDVAPEWRQQIRDLGTEDAALEAGGEALNAEIERLTAELATIGIDTEILSLHDRLNDLDRLRTRHDAASEDLPDRGAALDRIDGQIAHFLMRLGKPDAKPEDLLFSTSRTAALRDLIDARASLDVRLASAKKEAADARASREEANAQLQASGEHSAETALEYRPTRIAALSETLTLLRNSDHDLRHQSAERAIASARQKSETLALALAPWQGDIADLRTMRPPSGSTLRNWKSDAEQTERKRAAVEEEISRLNQKLRRLEAEADALAQSRSLPSSLETETLRQTRDEAWALHKTTLEPKTADAFETTMRTYDEAADKRSAHQADVAKLNEITVQTAITRAELQDAATTRTDLEKARTELGDQMAAAMRNMSAALPADMTLEALEDWLQRRELVLEADDALRAHLQDLETANQDRQIATDRLVRALTPLDPDITGHDDLDALVNRAQHVISRETRADALRQSLAEQERSLKRRELDLRTAEEEVQGWMLGWKEACAGCWLGEGEKAPTAAEVREALPVLGELATALHDRASLADRIAKMERDQAGYIAALHATASEAGLETDTIAPASLARQLAERLATAERDSSRHEQLSRQIEDATARLRLHTENTAAHAVKRSQMLNALGVESFADAALCIEQALERKQLGQRIEQIASEICEALGASSLDEARTLLQAADTAQLRDEKQELEASLETLDAEVQHLYAAQTRASDAMYAVGGDDAVARIEQQRKTILLAIADGAEHYLRLSAGIIAMEQALTLYRERHSSSMMQRASQAIRTISRGRYTGLASQPDHGRDKGRELLIAIQNDGTSKQAADMSKGARFQLYLALRVAGFHEFAATRQTVPFIADDIMETFDDFRAEEAFRLFADMARVGQVIYLTHHRHLCDIAKSVCPDVKIHELSA